MIDSMETVTTPCTGGIFMLQYRHLKKTNATKTTSRASNTINVRQ